MKEGYEVGDKFYCDKACLNYEGITDAKYKVWDSIEIEDLYSC